VRVIRRTPVARLTTGNRFDIEDRKGLEIVTLAALLTFQDASDSYHESPKDSNATTPPSSSPPAVPPKPTRKTGVERIAEIQAGRGEVNEVLIVDECSYKDYAQYCARLLQVWLVFPVAEQNNELDSRTKRCYLFPYALQLHRKFLKYCK
jgi:hypothetical protein